MADLKALAARARGLAPPRLSANARAGAVFTADDKSIHFPTDALPNSGQRNLHANRRVIIFQEYRLNTAAAPPTILVIPCSASASKCSAWDFEVPKGEGGFDAERVVAYVSMVQPILKSHLLAHKGDLSADALSELRKRMLAVIGISGIGALELPSPPVGVGRERASTDE